jgi:Ion transport protein
MEREKSDLSASLLNPDDDDDQDDIEMAKTSQRRMHVSGDSLDKMWHDGKLPSDETEADLRLLEARKLRRWRQRFSEGDWLERIRLAEEHRAYLWTLIGLIVLDLVIVMTELLLDCEVVVDKDDMSESQLHSVEVAEEVLHVLSVTILGLFLIEIILRMFAHGRHFFTSIGHLVDAAVVIASFVLELALSGAAKDVVGLLIVLRVWRLGRVIHAGIEITREQYALQMTRVKRELDACRQHNADLRVELARLSS